MKNIGSKKGNFTFIAENIVLFEALPDVVIDKQTALDFYDGIEQQIPGNYGLIILRKHKYQLLRIEVFNIINSRERLAGMAIVTPTDVARKMADMEASLCEKPFSTFNNVEDATTWIKTLLKN